MGLPLGVAEDIAAAAPLILEVESVNETLAALLRDMESGAVSEVIEAIDQALTDGSADLEDRMAVRPLVAAARYKAQRGLVIRDGRLIAKDAEEVAKTIPPRRMLEDRIWNDLQSFAARTYVPASEASRLKGAGAGLSDND